MPSPEAPGAPRTDLRMPALGSAAWCGALAAQLGGGWLLLTVTAAPLAGAGLVAWRGDRRPLVTTLTAVGVVAIGVGVTALVRLEATSTNPVAQLARDHAVVSVVGRVVSDPRPISGPGEQRWALRMTARAVRGRGEAHRLATSVLVFGDAGWRDVELGSLVRVGGRLAPADDGDLAALLPAFTDPEVLRGPDAWWRGATAVRKAIRESVSHRSEAERSLVPALVVGDDAELPTHVAEEFRVTGLTHLTAVSGTNLTLVVGFLLVLGRWCGVRGRWQLLLGVLGIAGFVLLARTEPSVVRAAAMGAVGLLALGANGRHRALRGLGVAVMALLLVDPSLALTVGFALSVLATAGIVLLAPGWRDALAAWTPRWLAEAVAVPAAAQIAVTPVVAAISGEVSLVAVGANLLVAPVVGPATVLGLLAGLVTLLWSAVGAVLGTGAAWCVAWIVKVAEIGAGLPAAAVAWGTGAVALVLLTALCVVVAMLVPHVLRRPLAAMACCVLVLVTVAGRWPTPGWPPAGWVLVMCDVGQGDALALRVAGDAAVVVDTGPEPAAVDRCLSRLGVERVPIVVLTHFHADHVDGLAGVIEGRRVGAVETTGTLDPMFGVEAVTKTTRSEGLLVALSPYAEPRTVGWARLQTLWPEPGSAETGSDGTRANDASVVLLVEAHGVRMLLTGDIEPPGQAALARTLPDLDVDVLKVPHHGSRYQDVDWLTSLRAESALVSVGADNDYGHPAEPMLDELRRAGSKVHRTDLHGDVAVAVVDGAIVVRTRR